MASSSGFSEQKVICKNNEIAKEESGFSAPDLAD
jgi:hypothetical protein